MSVTPTGSESHPDLGRQVADRQTGPRGEAEGGDGVAAPVRRRGDHPVWRQRHPHGSTPGIDRSDDRLRRIAFCLRHADRRQRATRAVTRAASAYETTYIRDPSGDNAIPAGVSATGINPVSRAVAR